MYIVHSDKPGPPSAVKVARVGKNYADLEWNKPTTDGGSKVTGYQIYMADSSPPDWQELTKVKAFENSFTVKQLEEGKTYHFAVAAINEAGVGDHTESDKTVKLEKPVDKPSSPVGPIEIEDVQKTGATLSWQPSKKDGGSPITAYIVEQREGWRSSWKPCGKTKPDEHTLVVDGLKEGQDYFFRIIAENAAGKSEPLEMDGSVKPRAPFSKYYDSYSILINILVGDQIYQTTPYVFC